MIFQKKKDYKVKLRGRSKIEYIEGDRRLLIASEFLAGDAGIVVYSDGLDHWEAPHEHIALRSGDLLRVRENVLKDLAEHQIKAEWD